MKRFSLIVLLLCCGIRAWSDNIITLSSIQGTANTEVTVSVALTNTDAVSAIQLSIPLDDNLTFVENSQQSGSRFNGHVLSAGVKDGVLNLMAYSSTMATMRGNEGEVFSFKLLLGSIPGTISLSPSKVALTDNNGNSVAASATTTTVDIRGAKLEVNKGTLDFGRVGINSSATQSMTIRNEGNEPLVISAINFSSTFFSISASIPLTINAGSSQWLYVNFAPTALGAIDEEMTLVSNNVSGDRTIRLTATPYGKNELRLNDASGITGEEVTVPVIMENVDDISGLQMEIKIPNELEYVDGSFVLSGRKQDHIVTASMSDGLLSVVTYSQTDKTFTGNEGEVGSFKVRIVGGDNCNLNIEKAALSSIIDGKITNVSSDKFGCTVTVKSPNMYASSNLNFGSISVKEQTIQKSFDILNRGSAPLTISKVSFANGLFNVKEDLPLTIEPSSDKSITIACEPKDVIGDISTNMEVYTNDPQRQLFIVKITGSIFTPDYMTGTIDANGICANLNISLNNYSNIYGMQFDIHTTKEFTASTENVKLTDRGKNLSVTINKFSDDKLRVVAYAKNDQFIGSGDGEVMSIKLVPKDVLPEGHYTLTLKSIMLGSKGMQNLYAGTDLPIDFEVSGVIPGDANKDGKVGIGDIIAIMNIMAGNTTDYDIIAADANQDNKVDKEDIDVIESFMAGY